MNEDKDTGPNHFNREHLKHRYIEERREITEDMRRRQGELNEKNFQSLVAITTARVFREQLKSEKDDLTGLVNRKEFVRRLNAAINFVSRTGGSVDVMEIDLDGFKKVNDQLGHTTGDGVLKELAELLSGSVRSYDLVARLGGDEFAILRLGSDHEAIQKFVDRIKGELITNPRQIKGLDLISASIGVASYHYGDEVLKEGILLKRADVAMYNAKSKEGTQVVFWEEGMVIPPEASSRR